MKRVAVVGTISNASANLRTDLQNLINALKDFEIVQIFLVESDSTDSTILILEKLREDVTDFDFITLGALKEAIPERINRIRHCRNIYVKKVRSLLNERELDFVVVADLDGMNARISAKALESCFIRTDWAGVLANQTGGYYDLLALRHPTWCPQDVLSELQYLKSSIDRTPLPLLALIRRARRRLEYDRARNKAIYSKMVRFSKSDQWIEVNSGFGGLGIYKASIFAKFDYSLREGDLDFESEHVAFSKRIVESGEKIFINPRLINNHFNTYNLNKFMIIRQAREIYWNSLSRLKELWKE
jgi:glycosyltransferase involved in cell wall biosynthesis